MHLKDNQTEKVQETSTLLISNRHNSLQFFENIINELLDNRNKINFNKKMIKNSVTVKKILDQLHFLDFF